MKQRSPASRQEFLLTNCSPTDINLSTSHGVLACRLGGTTYFYRGGLWLET